LFVVVVKKFNVNKREPIFGHCYKTQKRVQVFIVL
jgi:hypothetical protein